MTCHVVDCKTLPLYSVTGAGFYLLQNLECYVVINFLSHTFAFLIRRRKYREKVFLYFRPFIALLSNYYIVFRNKIVKSSVFAFYYSARLFLTTACHASAFLSLNAANDSFFIVMVTKYFLDYYRNL